MDCSSNYDMGKIGQSQGGMNCLAEVDSNNPCIYLGISFPLGKNCHTRIRARLWFPL